MTNKHFAPLLLIVALAASLTSCLNDDDETASYTLDTALTAFSIGTLNYHCVTYTATGDSVEKDTTYDASSTVFYIDQLRGEVYNPTPLPHGVDLSKVVASISIKNSGVIGLQHIDNDSVSYFSTTDSVDFSRERVVQVFSADLSTVRKYRVNIAVAPVNGDKVEWTSLGTNAALASESQLKAVVAGSQLLVFAPGKVFGMSTTATSGLQQLQANVEIGADAPDNVAVMGGKVYMFDGRSLLRSADGASWEAVSEPAISQLLGATTCRLYGRSATGIMVSTDEGATWSDENIDAVADSIPTEGISFVSMPVATADSTDRATLVGYAHSGDVRHGVSWSKYDEYGFGRPNQSWTFNQTGNAHSLAMPALSQFAVVSYDGHLLALGSDGTFRRSIDGALTWKADATVWLPAAIAGTFAFTADASQWLYIIDAATGTVWKGRHNRMAWSKN